MGSVIAWGPELWEVMSRRRAPRTGRPSPEGVHVDYALLRRWGFRKPAIVMRADGRVAAVALTSDSPDVLLTGLQPHGDEDI